LRLVAGVQFVAADQGEGSCHQRSVRRAANERPTYAWSMPSLYEMTADIPFVAPVMVGAFDGWIDASAAATSAAATLAENGEVVARFDGDALYDYRARRPVLDVVDGTLARLEWPELTVRSVEAGGRHLLILTGPEPDYHWRQMGTDVLDLCLRVGVVQWVSLGAIPAAVPHTRPVPVLATASKDGLLHEDESKGPQGLLRVPGAALSTLELAVSGTGIPACARISTGCPDCGGGSPSARSPNGAWRISRSPMRSSTASSSPAKPSNGPMWCSKFRCCCSRSGSRS
jgi:hypothetical protein